VTGAQSLLFEPCPVEEFYDTQTDPWEIRNLAADVQHRGDLQRLRIALDGWLDEVGDMGAIGEHEMVRRWYPDGKQPHTAAPLFVPISAERPGIDAAPAGGAFRGPLLLQLHCATQGASIACTFESGATPRWKLYSEPLRLPAGETTVRARAIRVGYAESEEREAKFCITE
jgi:hypothetical protein